MQNTKVNILLAAILIFSTKALAEIGALDVNLNTGFDVHISTPAENYHASDLIEAAVDQFGEILKLYNQSPAATEVQVMGWMSGRCYMHDARTKPRPVLLAGYTKNVDEDNGQMFPPQDVSKLTIIEHSSRSIPADYFDQMTTAQEEEVEDALNYDFDNLTELKVEDGSLVSTSRTGGVQYRVRVAPDYLVAEAVVVKSNDVIKTGETFAACYFFKKIK